MNTQSYQDESLRPVTIKQIVEAEDVAGSGSDFKIDGHPISQLTFIGQIRSVNEQPTNATYRIDDGTGQIEVKKWTDPEAKEDNNVKLEVDSFVRVFGRLKSFHNKRHVGAHVLRPVTDFNEVNYHTLEATYAHLFYTRGPAGQQNGNGDSMFVDGGNGASNGNMNGGQHSGKLTQCSPAARRMFQAMSSASGGAEGFHLQTVTGQTGMSAREVIDAADELLGQGLIYTTVDDETWAVLEY